MVYPRTPKHTSYDLSIKDGTLDAYDLKDESLGLDKFNVKYITLTFETGEDNKNVTDTELIAKIPSLPYIDSELTLDTTTGIKSFHFVITTGQYVVVLDDTAKDTLVVKFSVLL